MKSYTNSDLPRTLYRAEFSPRLRGTAPKLSESLVNRRKLAKLGLASELTMKAENETVSCLIMKSIYPPILSLRLPL